MAIPAIKNGVLDILDYGVTAVMGIAAACFLETRTIYLELDQPELSSRTEEVVRSIFDTLSEEEKNLVYGKVWELAKMQDTTIQGRTWGEEHVFENLPRIASALRRLGFMDREDPSLRPLELLPYSFGEGGLGSQYFSLPNLQGHDPDQGLIGYVNGMGMPRREYVEEDAREISENFCSHYNLHIVYNSTHQKRRFGDKEGFKQDILRMKAIEGGCYGKTAYLLAQQWADYLIDNPDHNFLQIAHSEGAAHTFAALRLIAEADLSLLSRLRVITLCPGHFIVPSDFPGTQIMNFVKNEDGVVVPLATGSRYLEADYTVVVPNREQDDPHNPLSPDFQRAVKPYIDRFIATGEIL